MKQKYVLNEWIDVVLEDDGRTNIYVAGEEFAICKYVLLAVPTDVQGETIDEIIENTPSESKILEGQENFGIVPAETAFFVHCSNLQAWVDNDYEPALLDARLCYPILGRLRELGDVKAKRLFETLVETRLFSGNIHTMQALAETGVLDALPQDVLRKVREHIASLIGKPLPKGQASGIPGRARTLELEEARVCVGLYPYETPDHVLHVGRGAWEPAVLFFDEKQGLIYLGFNEGPILGLDWDEGRVKQFYGDCVEWMAAIVLDEGRKYLAASYGGRGRDGYQFTVYDIATGAFVLAGGVDKWEGIPVMAFSSDGNTLYHSTWGLGIVAISLPGGEELFSFPSEDYRVFHWDRGRDRELIQTSHDGKHAFVYRDFSATVIAVDVETGAFLFKGEECKPETCVRVNPQTRTREVVEWEWHDEEVIDEEAVRKNPSLYRHGDVPMKVEQYQVEKYIPYDPWLHGLSGGIICDAKSPDEKVRVYWRKNVLLYEEETMEDPVAILATPLQRFICGPSADRESVLIWFVLERPFYGKKTDKVNGKVWEWHESKILVWNIPVLMYRWDVKTRELTGLNHDEHLVDVDRSGQYPVVRRIDRAAFDSLEFEPAVPDFRRVFGDVQITGLLPNDDGTRVATIHEHDPKHDRPPRREHYSGIFVWDVSTENITHVILEEDIPSDPSIPPASALRHVFLGRILLFDKHTLELVGWEPVADDGLLVQHRLKARLDPSRVAIISNVFPLRMTEIVLSEARDQAVLDRILDVVVNNDKVEGLSIVDVQKLAQLKDSSEVLKFMDVLHERHDVVEIRYYWRAAVPEGATYGSYPGYRALRNIKEYELLRRVFDHLQSCKYTYGKVDSWISKLTHPMTRPTARQDGATITITFPPTIKQAKPGDEGHALVLELDVSTFEVVRSSEDFRDKAALQDYLSIGLMAFACLPTSKVRRVLKWFKREYPSSA